MITLRFCNLFALNVCLQTIATNRQRVRNETKDKTRQKTKRD